MDELNVVNIGTLADQSVADTGLDTFHMNSYELPVAKEIIVSYYMCFQLQGRRSISSL